VIYDQPWKATTPILNPEVGWFESPGAHQVRTPEAFKPFGKGLTYWSGSVLFTPDSRNSWWIRKTTQYTCWLHKSSWMRIDWLMPSSERRTSASTLTQ
jgi:hypothetical protein